MRSYLQASLSRSSVRPTFHNDRRSAVGTLRHSALAVATLVGLSLSAIPASATVFEDGNSGTRSWRIAISSSSKPTMSTKQDAERGDKVMVLKGTMQDAFQLGSGSSRWRHEDEHVLSWSMKTSERFAVYVILETTRGTRFMRYTNSSKSALRYKPSNIDHGLGAASASGAWKTHVRDLQADLTAGESGNRIRAVNGFVFRGNARLDDIELHHTVEAARGVQDKLVVATAAPSPAPVATPEPVAAPAVTPEPEVATVTPAPVTSAPVASEPTIAAAAPAPTPAPTTTPVTSPSSSGGKTLAFPGAEGYGRFARGGRGGRVVIVDTLADVVSSSDGRTSLREALEVMKGPRTVVFEVGGTFDVGKYGIQMKNEDDSYVTLACQSAPAPGVLIRGNGIRIKGAIHDIVMRHCAIRNIDPGTPLSNSSRAIGVSSGSSSGRTRNMIFDHMSLGWATDENFTVFLGPTGKNDMENFTLSRSIIAEGDGDSTHPESGNQPNRYLHSMGPSCNSSSPNYRVLGCSIIGNMMAHNARRNPLMWGTSGEVLNNVVYNWYGTGLDARPHVPGRVDVHVSGNLFKSGPTSKPGKAPMVLIDKGVPASNFRVSDNRFIDGATGAARSLANQSRGTPDRNRNAATAMNLSCVGASRPERSGFDSRMLAEYRDGSGQVGIGFGHERDFRGHQASRHPDSHDTDRDGMADAWETANGLNPNDSGDHSRDADGDGYTNIEEYLADIGAC